MKITSIAGHTIDELCFEHYGKTAHVVEQVLSDNPQLTFPVMLSPRLPGGTTIDLPAEQKKAQKTLALWD